MKYFIGFMVTVIIIIVLLAMSLGNVGKKSKPKTANTDLISYSTKNSSVRMVVDGPVTANETHNKVVVTVNRDKTVYEQINGYDGKVIKSESFDNNENSYTNFLSALQRASYMRGDKDPDHTNYRGYCSLNNRYIFSLSQDNKTIQQFWTTDCGSPKTYFGNFYLTYTLFQAQVPNYSDLTSELNL